MPCKYYARGRCTRQDCKFSHIKSDNFQGNKTCRFSAAKCPYGRSCFYQHDR